MLLSSYDTRTWLWQRCSIYHKKGCHFLAEILIPLLKFSLQSSAEIFRFQPGHLCFIILLTAFCKYLSKFLYEGGRTHMWKGRCTCSMQLGHEEQQQIVGNLRRKSILQSTRILSRFCLLCKYERNRNWRGGGGYLLSNRQRLCGRACGIGLTS